MTAAEKLAETIRKTPATERVKVMQETGELVREFLDEMEWRLAVCRDISTDLTPEGDIPIDWRPGPAVDGIDGLVAHLSDDVHHWLTVADRLAWDEDMLAEVERRLVENDRSDWPADEGARLVVA